jgi:hypothetical protein
MPGLPPAPTGIGKIDTGLTAGSPREAASSAVATLRDLKGHYPAAAPQIDGMIQAIVAMSKPQGANIQPGANDGVSLAGGAAPPPAPANVGGMDAE